MLDEVKGSIPIKGLEIHQIRYAILLLKRGNDLPSRVLLLRHVNSSWRFPQGASTAKSLQLQLVQLSGFGSDLTGVHALRCSNVDAARWSPHFRGELQASMFKGEALGQVLIRFKEETTGWRQRCRRSRRPALLNRQRHRVSNCGHAVPAGHHHPELKAVADRGRGEGSQRGRVVACSCAKCLPRGAGQILPLVSEGCDTGSRNAEGCRAAIAFGFAHRLGPKQPGRYFWTCPLNTSGHVADPCTAHLPTPTPEGNFERLPMSNPMVATFIVGPPRGELINSPSRGGSIPLGH